ncbi:MAG: hypothetical protein AVDCRST_MAG96-3793 [uncultured Segetibacter sp.]|uniref:Uncharacterized protein n=1 Tax=uncultured Segetibacter sp. TaxID=481133 RepID=A0A6J4TWL3_9BACT|nr:MAG: hypothetical protein AVDCRST_MAG96-3793 [uncultured Segetibacter sp.]
MSKGIKGKTSIGDMHILEVNQQAKQMDDFAMAIKKKTYTGSGVKWEGRT